MMNDNMEIEIVGRGMLPMTTIITGSDASSIKSHCLHGPERVAVSAWWPEIKFGGSGSLPEPRTGPGLRDKCQTIVGRTFTTLSPIVLSIFQSAVRRRVLTPSEVTILYADKDKTVEVEMFHNGIVIWPGTIRYSCLA